MVEPVVASQEPGRKLRVRIDVPVIAGTATTGSVTAEMLIDDPSVTAAGDITATMVAASFTLYGVLWIIRRLWRHLGVDLIVVRFPDRGTRDH